jgi:hypothetical protein
MTDRNLTDLTAVIDRSGSMSAIRSDMEGGFNKLIADQRKVSGVCKVSLVRFDTEYETVYTAIDIKDVPPLTIEPRGMTALLDAIGRTIISTGERLAAMPEDQRPGLVTFIIVTDGLENSSVEYKPPEGLARIHEMITRQREQYNWLFVFLGANQDAIATAAAMGMPANVSVTYRGGAGGQSAVGSTSSLLSATRMHVNSGMSTKQAVETFAYSDKDREKAVDDNE